MGEEKKSPTLLGRLLLEGARTGRSCGGGTAARPRSAAHVMTVALAAPTTAPTVLAAAASADSGISLFSLRKDFLPA